MEYLGRPVGMSNKPDPIPLNTAGFYLRGGGGLGVAGGRSVVEFWPC